MTSLLEIKPSISRIDIDPHGDLILEVTTPDPPTSMRVSSKTLCLVSPVFRKMLGPSSEEGIALQENTGEDPITIEFNEDEFGAALIIMNAIHLRALQVPNTVTVDALWNIAYICDKYKLAESLVPWVRIWTGYFTGIAEKPGYERWFFISWVFRQSKIFSDVTRKLIFDTKLVHGRLQTDSYDDVENSMIPNSVIETIRAERKRIVSSLISHAIRQMKKYKDSALGGKYVCNALFVHTGGKSQGPVPGSKRSECDSINVGALYRCLLVAGILPNQNEAEQRAAIRIAKDLQSMGSFGGEISEETYTRNVSPEDHFDCGPKIEIEVLVRDTLDGTKGLNLEDFLPKELIFFLDEDSGVLILPGKKNKDRLPKEKAKATKRKLV